MAIVAVSEVLREKLGKDGVDSLLELLSKEQEDIKSKVIELSEGRFEKRLTEEISSVRSDIKIMEGLFKQKLSEEITLVRADFKEGIASIRAEFKEEIALVRADLKEETSKIRVEMSQFKTEIIKWMFLFWVGQLVCVAGLIKWLR